MPIRGGRMPLTKPPGVESDPFKLPKRDEITRGRGFSDADAPAFALLAQRCQVVDRCMEDMGVDGGVQAPSRTTWGISRRPRRYRP